VKSFTHIVLTCVALTTASASSSPFAKLSENRLLHRPSNVVLPARIALFQRVHEEVFETTGRDVGLDYDLDQLIRADVYVYPVGFTGYGKDLTSEFRHQQADIRKLNRNVELVSQTNFPLSQSGRTINGSRAQYVLTRELFAKRNCRCGSQLYVFRDGKWFIAYRFSYPIEKSNVANEHIRSFLAQWQWHAR
jgi:hypothetical protein